MKSNNVRRLTTGKFLAVINKNFDFKTIVRVGKCLSEHDKCDVKGLFNLRSLDTERAFS